MTLVNLFLNNVYINVCKQLYTDKRHYQKVFGINFVKTALQY